MRTEYLTSANCSAVRLGEAETVRIGIVETIDTFATTTWFTAGRTLLTPRIDPCQNLPWKPRCQDHSCDAASDPSHGLSPGELVIGHRFAEIFKPVRHCPLLFIYTWPVVVRPCPLPKVQFLCLPLHLATHTPGEVPQPEQPFSTMQMKLFLH